MAPLSFDELAGVGKHTVYRAARASAKIPAGSPCFVTSHNAVCGQLRALVRQHNLLGARARAITRLRILQQMDECRDDNSFNLLQADLQNVLNFESVSPTTYGRFVERHVWGESSLHVHNVISLGWRAIDLCTVLQSSLPVEKD